MRIRCVVVLAVSVFALLLAGCYGSRNDPSPADKLQSSVDSNWTQYVQDHGLPGGGMAVYLETPTGNYFASCNMPPGVDQNSRFRIASNTKTFTAAAIMLLNQQGKLNIDDTIVSNIPGTAIPYVPETTQYDIPYKTEITIRHLLSHTAGVYDVTNETMPVTCPSPYAGRYYVEYVLTADPSHQFSPGEFVGVDATCKASYFIPGTDYEYSNTGYSILAEIIERVSGLAYDQFLMQNLIVPNGLSSTSVPMLVTDQSLPAPFTRGYRWDEGAFFDVTVSNMSVNIAEGNITSTPADLARWIKRLISAQAGPKGASVIAMETPTQQSIAHGGYGLGITYAAGLGYGHTGSHEGYLSAMVHDPIADVTIIVYFNVWDYANLQGAQMSLLGKAARDARAAVGY